MIEAAVNRASEPARGLLEEIGDMMILAGRTIASALKPPYPYGGEFVSQFLFALRLCWFPLLVSAATINYAARDYKPPTSLRSSERSTASEASSSLARSVRSAPR